MIQRARVTVFLLPVCFLIATTGCKDNNTGKTKKKELVSTGVMEIRGLEYESEPLRSEYPQASITVSEAKGKGESDLLEVGFGFNYATEGTGASFLLFFDVTPESGVSISGTHTLTASRPTNGNANQFVVTRNGRSFVSTGGFIELTYDSGNLEGTFEVEVSAAQEMNEVTPHTVSGFFRSSSVGFFCMTPGAPGTSGGGNADMGDPGGQIWNSADLSNEFCQLYF